MGWAGTHEFVDKSLSNLLPAYAIHNNYNELQFNEKQKENTEKLSTWFCLSIVIGFSRDDSRSGVEMQRMQRMRVTNGSTAIINYAGIKWNEEKI
jgi:hypothetical protein